MNKKNTSQIGRTLFETILVLIVMGIISIGVYKIYTIVVKKSASHNLSREINTRVVQLRHQAMTSQGIQPVTLEQALVRINSKQSGSGLPIQVQPEAESFKLIIGSGDYPLKLNVCENVLSEYQLNSKICFLSGECKDLTGELIFSNICNPHPSHNQDEENIEPIDCGAHSYQVGRNCVCEDGYENWTAGSGCSLIELNCGANAQQDGTECVCEDGYENWISGSGCSLIELNCGANAQQDGTECVCEDGYENWISGSGCSLIELDCGSNAYQDGTECVCDEGYENWTESTGCTQTDITCPEGEFLHPYENTCYSCPTYDDYCSGDCCEDYYPAECPENDGMTFSIPIYGTSERLTVQELNNMGCCQDKEYTYCSLWDGEFDQWKEYNITNEECVQTCATTCTETGMCATCESNNDCKADCESENGLCYCDTDGDKQCHNVQGTIHTWTNKNGQDKKFLVSSNTMHAKDVLSWCWAMGLREFLRYQDFGITYPSYQTPLTEDVWLCPSYKCDDVDWASFFNAFPFSDYTLLAPGWDSCGDNGENHPYYHKESFVYFYTQKYSGGQDAGYACLIDRGNGAVHALCSIP